MKCKHKKPDGTACNSFAMKGKSYCWRHSPELSDEEKRKFSANGGKTKGEDFIENLLPELKIENFKDIASMLTDTINNLRQGKISQKTGSSIGYLSFILLMAMDKAKAEEHREQIDKLKAEGKWRPEPKFQPKVYLYKDNFYLDKDGNPLYVERDSHGFDTDFIPEVKPQQKPVNKSKHKRKPKPVRELTQEEHEKLMDDPNYHNFRPLNGNHVTNGNGNHNIISVPINGSLPEDEKYIKESVEMINHLNEEVVDSV
jgi:hypothetical protein